MDRFKTFFNKIIAGLKKWVGGIDIPSLAFSAFCIVALSALFILWKNEKGTVSSEGLRSAIIVTVLFAIVGTVFVFKWFKEFGIAAKKRILPTLEEGALGDFKKLPKEENITALKVFGAVALVNLLVIAFMWLLQCVVGNVQSFSDALTLWTKLDSQHYLHIAEHWYAANTELGNDVRIVFFPAYPITVKLVRFIVRDYFAAGMITSGLFYAGSGSMMYLLLRLDYSKETALRAVKYLCLVPGAFFFVAPMSESLFVFTTLAAIYFARREKFIPSALFGFVAAFTRSLGVIVLVPIVYELIVKTICERPRGKALERRIYEFLSVLLTPCGLATYLFINYKVTGDAFKFLEYQKSHWGQEITYFFNTASYQTDNFINRMKDNPKVAIALWLMGLCALFGALVILILASKKMRASYLGYSIVYYVIAMGATWLLSGPRYMAAMFTLPLSFALITRNKKVDQAVTILLTVIYVIYSVMFINRWQVW